MSLGVAGRLEHVHLQDACVEAIAVVDRTSLERHDLPSLYGVRRTGPLDHLQAAGDVVVVQVRFQDEHAIPALRLENVLHPVQVALGVDDDRLATGSALANDVAAITKLGGLDSDDLHEASTSFVLAVSTGVRRRRGGERRGTAATTRHPCRSARRTCLTYGSYRAGSRGRPIVCALVVVSRAPVGLRLLDSRTARGLEMMPG